MKMSLFDKIAKQVKPYIKHTYLHLWGEPTLHPDLPEMIDTMTEFSTVDLATHGMFVDDALALAIAKCDTISVSIDGIGQEVYEKYRVRGNYEQAMDGLKRLARLAPGRVNWTFILFSHNEHQIEEAKAIAKDLNVNLGFKPPYLIDPVKQKEMLPKNEAHRRYHVQGDGSLLLKSNPLSCKEFWETVYVLPNGDVVTCCYDYAAMMVMGNMNEKPMLEIWNDEPYQKARESHRNGVLNPMCAKLCKLPA
jgi:radical SAM protein with 4Fe4S-binding SPASM domain